MLQFRFIYGLTIVTSVFLMACVHAAVAYKSLILKSIQPKFYSLDFIVVNASTTVSLKITTAESYKAFMADTTDIRFALFEDSVVTAVRTVKQSLFI